jgi:cell division protein YceG involved in septum cleavage
LSRGDRSRQAPERTPEEREQARLERERRRARRTGAPEPAEPAPSEASLEPAWEATPQHAPEPVEAEWEAPLSLDTQEADEHHTEAPHEQPLGDSHPGPLGDLSHEGPRGDHVHEEPLRDPHPTEESEALLYADPLDAEPPSEEHPTVGPSSPPAAPSVPPAPPAPPRTGAPNSPSSPEPGHARHRRSIPSRVAAAVALALVLVVVVILARSLGHTGSSSHTSSTPAVVKVVIPEGETRLQIARIAKRAHLSGDYLAGSRRSPLLDPSHYGAPGGTRDLEGFLFPDTYDMNPGEPVGRLVEAQLVAFREHFGISEIQRAHALHVTPYQLLIVASMIEREAQVTADRAKIAAVIYNRLRRGMPLAIDATLYYALAQRGGLSVYGHELTESELHMSSAYNTRTHAGLPPTPIANPGAASIQAAAHPVRAPYLYYVLAPDGCGEHVFSTTSSEFETAAAAYRAALQRNGGRLPVCKRKR